MLPWLVAVAGGVAAALLQYGWRASPPLAARALPAALRAGAVALLLALVLDAPVGRAAVVPPVAALDVSASWLRGRDSSAWREALARVRALRADTLLLVGDSARDGRAPAAPLDLASRVGTAVDRATALGRPLAVVTDGELDDPEALAALPRGSRVDVVRRAPTLDAAVVTLEVPRAVVSEDTVIARVGVAAGAAGARPATLTFSLGGAQASSASLDSLPPFGERTVDLRTRVRAGDGAVLALAVVSSHGDAERRNDTLAAAVEVSPAAGAVFVSTSPDLDARYAVTILRGALALPTRGFFRVAPGAWRVEGTLAPVAEADVRRAAREAPLLVIHGDSAVFGPPLSATRAPLALVAPPPAAASAQAGEEWYATEAPPSPLAAALAALPWDSLPPLDVSPSVPRGEWVGLVAKRGRRFEPRSAVSGVERPRRRVVVGASGFWRWHFRGGVGADAYAALWGSIFDWLAAERSDPRSAVPEDGLVRAGEPVRWRRGSSGDSTVAVELRRRGDASDVDTLTLRFAGGTSVAESPSMAAGIYDVRTPGGASMLVVNESRELLPRRATVRAGVVGGGPSLADRPRFRARAWPFVLLLLLLAAEWLLRRRLGLR